MFLYEELYLLNYKKHTSFWNTGHINIRKNPKQCGTWNELVIVNIIDSLRRIQSDFQFQSSQWSDIWFNSTWNITNEYCILL